MGVQLIEKMCHILNRCIKKFSFWLKTVNIKIVYQVRMGGGRADRFTNAHITLFL